MNVARVETTIALLLIAAFGVRRYRAFLNPISLAALPLAGALVAEELLLGAYAPFDLPAGLFIVGAALFFAMGAVLRPAPTPTSHAALRIKPRGFAIGLVLCVLSVLLFLGTIRVRDIYDTHALDINNPVFDRGLVVADLTGIDSLVARIVTAVGILFAVPVGLYWLSHARFRILLVALYLIDLASLGLALRARLPVLLAILLCILVIYLGRSVTQRRPRALATTIGIVALLAGVYFAFNTIYAARNGTTQPLSAFVYSIAGGPSALSEVISGTQSVSAHGGQGVSIEGLLSFVGRQRTLGNFTFVTLGAGPGQPPVAVNIFTGIGVLFLDIGYLPTLTVFFLLGVVAESAWVRVVGKPRPGSITVLAGLALLCVSLPVCTLSRYNFWWLIFLGPLVVNRMFRVELLTAAPGAPLERYAPATVAIRQSW
jgi:hypothetical protein